MSETHLRADKPYDIPYIEGYTPYNTERKGDDKGGGGLTLLYKSDLPVHPYEPTVPEHLQYVENERQWLLFGAGCRKLAFLHCYLACQSNRHNFVQWNEDLFFLMGQEAQVLKRQGFMVFALGDFNTRVGQLPGLEGNTDDTNRNYPMFMNFIQETNLMIVNTLPIANGLFTWFGDKHGQPASKSLLDYGLIDPEGIQHISSFVIDDNARFRVGGDHALLDCTLTFDSSVPKIDWHYKDVVYYNINDDTSYKEYSQALEACISSIALANFENLPTPDMLQHLTESINSCALKTIGVKMVKKRKGRKLPHSVTKLIKEKNNLICEQANDGCTSAKAIHNERKIKVY